jgi:hypothetical protein
MNGTKKKKAKNARTASPLCPAPKRTRVFAAFPPYAHATIPVTPMARSDFVVSRPPRDDEDDDGTDVERLDDDDDDDDDTKDRSASSKSSSSSPAR